MDTVTIYILAKVQCIHSHPGSTFVVTTVRRSAPYTQDCTLFRTVHKHNNTVPYIYCTVLHSTIPTVLDAFRVTISVHEL